jgi:hypothetical protein
MPSIVFAGHEGAAWQGGVWTTTLSGHDAAMNRCVLCLNGAEEATRTFTPITEGSFRFRMGSGSRSGSGNSDQLAFALCRADGGIFLSLLCADSFGYYRNWRLTTTGNSTTVVSGNSSFGVATFYDVEFKADATNGYIRIYENGAPVYAFAGNTTTYFSSCGRVRFKGFSVSSGSIAVSECLMLEGANASTVGARVATLAFSAVGAVQQWDGDVAAINETSKDQATAIVSATAGQDTTYVLGDLPTVTGMRVFGLVLNADANTTGSGAPTTLHGLVRIGGTSYASSGVALSGTLTPVSFVWHLDPSTTAAFTATTINGAEAGFRSAT